MNHIDLVEFAELSEKIPEDFLIHDSHERREVSNFTIFIAHALDVFAIATISAFMISIYAASVTPLMTKSLARAFNQQDLAPYAMLSFPLTMATYFFCSYLLNNGQTWGMSVYKLRIDLSKVDYLHSFRWSAYSISVCFTVGLSLLFKAAMEKVGFGSFQQHDYLYADLMREREVSTPNLFELLPKAEERTEEEFEFIKAA